MIDLTVPAGQQPATLVHEVLVDVLDRQVETRHAPPKLQDSIDLARIAQEIDDLPGLDAALLDIAVGAIATVVRVRAAR